MHWTKQPPTEAGWYWWRENIAYHAKVVGVITCGVRIMARGVEANDMGGEWCGPLQEPGGDAIENCRPESAGAGGSAGEEGFDLGDGRRGVGDVDGPDICYSPR